MSPPSSFPTSPVCRSCSAFTLLELLLSLVVIAILFVVGFGSLQYMRESSRSVGCVAHLRALYVMMNQYANDHQNCYPIGYRSPSSWTGQTVNYRAPNGGAKEGITYCPSTSLNGKDLNQRDRNTWRTDYNINRLVATDVENNNSRSVIPGHLIFLFDGSGAVSGSASTSKVAARHRDRFNILFTDGHVEAASSITNYDKHWKR